MVANGIFNVLLVEDNESHAELAMHGLVKNSINKKVELVKDGEAALDYLFKRGGNKHSTTCPRPHLVLLDLRLPKLDGLQILKEIKSSPEINDIPVVILSTSRATTDMEEAYRQHANSYLVKPMEFDTFTEMMDALCTYWLKWNQKSAH